MTTNKPGSVNQQPLYGCTRCYEDWSWPADHLRVYVNECWCDLCWDERRWDFPDQPSWNDLEPYTPVHRRGAKPRPTTAKSKELCSENVCIAPRFGKESMCEYHHKKWQKTWDDYNEKFFPIT